MKRINILSLALIGGLIIFSKSLSAQTKTDVFDSADEPAAAAVAVNLKDTRNIVAGIFSNFVFCSFDQGKTWKKSFFNPPASGGEASIVSDYKGNFYLFYLTDSAGMINKMVMQRSEDGGKTWVVNEGPGLPAKYGCQYLNPYVDASNNLYLTWTQYSNDRRDENCQSSIMVSRSGSKGKKWSEPYLLSEKAGNCRSDDKTLTGSSVAVVGDEKIFAAWLNEGQMILDRTYDGKTWLNADIVITPQRTYHVNIPGFNGGVGSPIFVSDNGKSFFAGSLYLVMADRKSEDIDSDVVFLRSHNGGDNWTTPHGFSDDEPGTSQFKPAMTVDQETGYIYMVYYNQLQMDKDDTDVVISYSKDGGSSFKQTKITDHSFMPGSNTIAGAYTSIAANHGVIIPVWVEYISGRPKLKYVVYSQDMLIKK